MCHSLVLLLEHVKNYAQFTNNHAQDISVENELVNQVLPRPTSTLQEIKYDDIGL